MLKLLNQKGQVALFVALIFQVLFVFFAMIVNIGLLVHHKINLQNSVDLAAYYGAAKQAEMLNAIAHVNYQIRQSWKLLSFRYGQLGTAGAINQHPYRPGNLGQPGAIVRENDTAWNETPAFCLPYNPISLVTRTETYCRNALGINIPLPGVPDLGPANFFVNFQTAIRSAAEALKTTAQAGCQRSMASNWMQLAQFIQAYKLDVRNRKKLILALANEISKTDPRDIDGESIRTGVYRTLFKNLTYQNKESLGTRFREDGSGSGNQQANFEMINSFSIGDCGSQGSDISPPGWLSEILIQPYLVTLDGDCRSTALINLTANLINGGSATLIPQNVRATFPEAAESIFPYIQEFATSDPTQILYRSSLGFEKNPWCVGYIGVSASMTPKIPFTPLGDVTLKAVAYAKPFGGRIGPWFNDRWNQGENKSSESAKLTDKVSPIRVDADSSGGTVDLAQIRKDQRAFPNHSRYMGDQVGIRSELTMAQFGRAIHSNEVIDLNWYRSMGENLQTEFDQKGENGDILAWEINQNRSVPLRDLELAAIVPDQFDVAYYSIDPDFYNNYLKRIEKGYGNDFNFLLRGDLGSRMNGSEEEKRFSIRNQLLTLKDKNPQIIDWQGKLTYYISEFAQVLTSWQQKTPDEYVLDESRFGRCAQGNEVDQTEDEKFFTMGSCRFGGRTGYSVKIVDGGFLQNQVAGRPQDYELGGPGVSGQIKNPPPSDF